MVFTIRKGVTVSKEERPARRHGCGMFSLLVLTSAVLAGLKVAHVAPVDSWPWLWVFAPALVGFVVSIAFAVIGFLLRLALLLALVAAVAWLALGMPALPW